MDNKQWFKWILIVSFVLAHLVLGLTSAWQKSPTTDEYTYIASGYLYYQEGWDLRLDRTHPPLVRMFIGAPLAFYKPWMPPLQKEKWDTRQSYTLGYQIGWEMLLRGKNEVKPLLFWARLPILLLSCGMALVIFFWAHALYGVWGGLLSLCFYCFSPNLIAHARLATVDLGLCFFFLTTLYFYYRYEKSNKRRDVWLTGIFMGFAFAAKVTALLILPIIVISFLWKRICLPNHNFKTNWNKAFIDLALIIGCSILVLCMVYGYPIRPFYYGDTLANVFYKSFHTGQGDLDIPGMPHLNHAFYLFGNYSTEGWPYYYLAAILVKTPLPYFFALLVILIFSRQRWMGWPDMIIISVILLYMGAATFNRVNIGLRHILPVYPLLFVYLGRLALMKPHRIFRVLTILTVCWLIGVNGMIYPDYLAFFNAACGGPNQGQYYLDDSNIDWGQDLGRLKQIKDEYPDQPLYVATNWMFNAEVFGFKAQRFQADQIASPPNGIVAVGKHWAIRQRIHQRSPHYFDWFEKYTPITNVGHSIVVYRIE